MRTQRRYVSDDGTIVAEHYIDDARDHIALLTLNGRNVLYQNWGKRRGQEAASQIDDLATVGKLRLVEDN